VALEMRAVKKVQGEAKEGKKMFVSGMQTLISLGPWCMQLVACFFFLEVGMGGIGRRE
jgi:hypothetical protein